MKRCIVTFAAGAHEELLEISCPGYEDFARRHGYDFRAGEEVLPDWPAAWNKVPLLLHALQDYEEVVWFDCDLVVVDPRADFPPMRAGALHALVRHFERDSEVPNTGVWRLRRGAAPLLAKTMELLVFKDHGWWEQAAVMTLMGYTVPPQDSEFAETRCRRVQKTQWWERCQFMPVAFNSHPMYRAPAPLIVHCSYPAMSQRIEVMRALAADPAYDYPRYRRPAGAGLLDACEAALPRLLELKRYREEHEGSSWGQDFEDAAEVLRGAIDENGGNRQK